MDRARGFIDCMYAADCALVSLDKLSSFSDVSTVTTALDQAVAAYEKLLTFQLFSRLAISEELHLETVLDRLEVKMHLFGRSA